LELDLKAYLDADLSGSVSEIETKYELKSIVIHRGGAMGGHYHAFIRDDLGQGKWDIKVPDAYEE
jgi:uncharacterized UBP type Zn finger protein